MAGRRRSAPATLSSLQLVRQKTDPAHRDSYDNALAETINGLYKTELIRRRGPWHTVEHVELATAEWVDWWNQRRLHSATGYASPAEFEAAHYDATNAVVPAA
jgi:putative transposase